MNKSKRFLLMSFISVFLLCAVIFYMMTAYMYKQNDQAMRSVGRIYMSEISTQLQRHFASIINLRLSQVEGVIQRTPPETFENYGPEMLEELELSGQTRSFDCLALYSADGRLHYIYGETLEIINEQPFLDSLNAGENKLAQAVTASGQDLLLGVPTAYPLENGGTSAALLAGIDLSYIDYSLSLDADESLIYSHIIRKDGSFVIQSAQKEADSYFEDLRLAEGCDEPIENIIRDLQSAMETGGVYITNVMVGSDSERRKLYCVPLPHSEWYLINVMPHGKLDEAVQVLGNRRLEVSLGSCLAIIVLLTTLFLLYYRMSKHQMSLLKKAQIAAESASRAKSEFLSNMSHDIRTPMNAIVGMTAIASANLENSEQVQNCLRKITLSSKHLLGLINDVLDMSKIESGKLTLSRDLLSLRETMDSIVSIVQPQIKPKNQTFDIFIRDIQNEQVYADGVRLNQVLLNLLSNAIKFTPMGGRITVTMTQEDSPKGASFVRTHFWVKDNGIGMSEEFQKKIFESFVREDNARVHKTEGTGLGMAITKYIVDKVGGTIELKSELDKGSEFHVALDLERADENTEMVLPAWEMLVVDDDDTMCTCAVDVLKAIGVHAEWTTSGNSAIEMVEKRHKQGWDYHMVLLDWKMPDMSGIETARELRRRIGDSIPLLLISAYDWSDIEEDARAAGISGFISKPLFKSTLYHGLIHYADPDALKAAPTKQAKDFSGRRLLLAEDNDLNWEIANELLSAAGFELDWAENGQICVEKFQASSPNAYDAILMDLRMPVMNGYQATEAIRAMERPDAKTIPIIAMTADAFSEDVKKCLDCGMNAHVPKPLDIQELLRLLQKFFQKREQ